VTKKTKTVILTPLQVQDAVIGWALTYSMLTFEQTANAAATVQPNGGAKIRVKL
jgi:hypothetical protein